MKTAEAREALELARHYAKTAELLLASVYHNAEDHAVRMLVGGTFGVPVGNMTADIEYVLRDLPK